MYYDCAPEYIGEYPTRVMLQVSTTSPYRELNCPLKLVGVAGECSCIFKLTSPPFQGVLLFIWCRQSSTLKRYVFLWIHACRFTCSHSSLGYIWLEVAMWWTSQQCIQMVWIWPGVRRQQWHSGHNKGRQQCQLWTEHEKDAAEVVACIPNTDASWEQVIRALCSPSVNWLCLSITDSWIKVLLSLNRLISHL